MSKEIKPSTIQKDNLPASINGPPHMGLKLLYFLLAVVIGDYPNGAVGKYEGFNVPPFCFLQNS